MEQRLELPNTKRIFVYATKDSFFKKVCKTSERRVGCVNPLNSVGASEFTVNSSVVLCISEIISRSVSLTTADQESISGLSVKSCPAS